MEISKRENTLQLVNPSLAKQFHPTKNGNLTPYDVTYGSRINVWWRCEKGHEWEAEINNRNHGNGCPYCSGNKVGKYNNLAVKNPKLAKEWHPTKNGNLTPYDVTLGCGQKVWWRCEKGHEWEAQINSRNRGRGCRFCARQRE